MFEGSLETTNPLVTSRMTQALAPVIAATTSMAAIATEYAGAWVRSESSSRRTMTFWFAADRRVLSNWTSWKGFPARTRPIQDRTGQVTGAGSKLAAGDKAPAAIAGVRDFA